MKYRFFKLPGSITWVLTDPDSYVIGEYVGFKFIAAWLLAKRALADRLSLSHLPRP